MGPILIAGALVNVAVIAVFLVLTYRLAGIRPSPLEQRRMAVNFSLFVVMALVLAIVAAINPWPGFWLYGLAVVVAAYFGVRELQRRGHWLATPTAEDRALMPARRAAIASLARRPAFWMLVVGLVVILPLISVALVNSIR